MLERFLTAMESAMKSDLMLLLNSTSEIRSEFRVDPEQVQILGVDIARRLQRLRILHWVWTLASMTWTASLFVAWLFNPPLHDVALWGLFIVECFHALSLHIYKTHHKKVSNELMGQLFFRKLDAARAFSIPWT